MHTVDGRLLLSPTDLVGFLACDHLTQRELAAAREGTRRPERVDPELELLARKGQAHETTQLQLLASEHGYVEITDHRESLDGLALAETETLAAMRSGASVIYQAAFFDGRWRGRADFLLRVDTPSHLGPWSYEVADAKLARRVRPAALLQMCEYSHQLSRLQGLAPESMHVILGTGLQETHRVADYDAYFRTARARLEAVVDGLPQDTYPTPVDHCDKCSWLDQCKLKRRQDDHLCLVAGMRRDQTRRLVDAGISTVAALAVAPLDSPTRIGEAAWERLRRQAALQVEQRTTSRPVYELIDCTAAGLGLAALPEPSPGDLFFDMEGDPFAGDGGLEYLFGISEIDAGAACFTPFWGHDRAGEKVAFEALIDFIIERLDRNPTIHVYHYAQYEPVALKKLMSRHATREDQVDRLLRAGVLVDLYQVVRQGIRVSCESYGLKSLEVFFMPARTEGIADGAGSIVAYERWRDTRDPAELDNIAVYNERDCESTWRLRGWLEERREELARNRGAVLPRPEPRDGSPSVEVVQEGAETQELIAQLTEGLAADPTTHTPEEAARWLLAQQLGWHRREDKSGFWAYFERQTKTDDELMDDAESIGNIRHLGEVRTEKKSSIHRYAFDGTQEYKLGVGSKPHDPRTGKACGGLVAIDADTGELELSRSRTLADLDHPQSLIPGPPIPTRAMREALRRLASSLIGGGVDGPGGFRAARDLLLRRAPRVAGSPYGAALVGAGEDPAHAAVRLVGSLDHSYLAVQGPPGAGKTYSGASIVVDQVRRGRRVGICATSHRAIGELLGAVCAAAQERNTDIRILQKCEEGEGCSAAPVQHVRDNKNIDAALIAGEVDVVAGTQWLFARTEIAGQLDVLVIDEAGQMSLANALAVAGAATNLVLLGDPQQLAQPSQGIHPPGAGLSSLEHVLNGQETIPADRGVFLATTRRMHPDVCRFISEAFYDGRLGSHPDCVRQRIEGGDPIGGAGLRLAPVDHVGNRTWSPEEIAVVRPLVDTALQGSWTDVSSVTRPVGVDDILIVAPYNIHVRRLREGLPAGVRVGTVDKFQGQQAALTIYAMATSSAEDVPRNLEFLLNSNRLNVAVSRARALAVIVCSPQLLHAGCRTPEQLRLVSALCRFAEMATLVVGAEDRTGSIIPPVSATSRPVQMSMALP
ncbi:MAG: TM0106 family RecB-like putative nuclease [Candidatus Dormibacteraeota bacterium]|uniref:TM0106 family RecB-like putative nuclease n=1 Tax=Candidatus Amunia macphersoniae TaxID=3127014 RepID=A0A934NF51_9BACT|nr:TM0106 family RecB-like putative nuclease [Candidatus Dormibacteraeota bacterium]